MKGVYGMGYNATTDEVSNLFEDGIIDSSKSIKSALENAKSVTILLLNTRVVISI
jgi:chaperonin GroEL (HSP60 family)